MAGPSGDAPIPREMRRTARLAAADAPKPWAPLSTISAKLYTKEPRDFPGRVGRCRQRGSAPKRPSPKGGRASWMLQAAGARTAGQSDRAAAIYRSIFDAVVDQRLPPGAKLTEEQLGALFDASRTLVRSALQALAHDHIVTIERHRGAFVSAPTIADAQDIFFSRRMVEAGIALEVARKIQPADVAGSARAARRRSARRSAATTGNPRSASPEISIWRSPRIGGEGALTRFLSGLISRSSLVIALYGRGAAPSCARRRARGNCRRTGRARRRAGRTADGRTSRAYSRRPRARRPRPMRRSTSPRRCGRPSGH